MNFDSTSSPALETIYNTKTKKGASASIQGVHRCHLGPAASCKCKYHIDSLHYYSLLQLYQLLLIKMENEKLKKQLKIKHFLFETKPPIWKVNYDVVENEFVFS